MRYNLAYYPSDISFRAECVAFAKKHFSSHAESYLLDGIQALPHITICQVTSTEDSLDDIWNLGLQICAPTFSALFEGFYIRQGTEAHAGYRWAELR